MGIGSQDSIEVTGRATSGSFFGKQGAVMLAGLAAAILVLLGALTMLGDAGPGSSDGGAADRSGAAEGDGPSPTLAGFFTTTATAPVATPAVPTITPTTATPTTMAPGEFLLGEPTGLWLFYGGVDPLQRLDLDSAELIEFGLQASPILAVGEDVVLYQRDSGVVGWVSSANPAEQALNWKHGPVASGPGAELLWILDRSTDLEHPAGLPVGSGRWELFDPAANRVVDRRPGDLYPEVATANTDSFPLGGRFEALHPGPDFTTRADGVYAYGDDEYRPIGTGRVLTYDDSVVLLADCAECGTGCRYRWFDRETGRSVDRATPTITAVFAELLAEGRWLHAIDADGRSELLDHTTGNRMEFNRMLHLTISPGGRWLAYRDGESIVVADLAGDNPRTIVEYRDMDLDGGGDLLFVERSTTAERGTTAERTTGDR